ncbi:LuxR C-terminal-related transcriptional regulator [Microbacterium sp. 179-I 3D2 NHS]|uniref:hypothetical protein n=1 Tax=Microbacterium sp. 179-I 3D2 NHS TaxID=3235178 RepID=UPI0039A0F632
MTGAPVSPQASELLERVLRARPRFREELEALAAGPESSRHVAELVEHGFLAMDGDRVDITPPDRVVAAAILERIEEDRRATDAVASLLAQLPDLARAWDLGLSPEGQAIQGEVIEGDANALNRWYTLIARMTPNDPGASHPDLSFIHDHVVPNLDRFRDEFFGKGFAIRYLFPASAIASERDRAAIEVLHTLEAPVRVTTTLPSWFYVDRGVMAGLPQTWGATSPGGMVMVYSTPVVEAISWLFESLWDAATPLPVATEGWRPVLELMSRGRSDEQIAAMLGLGLRTVRRRIAEAMERFGVTTRFELGAAWARQRS